MNARIDTHHHVIPPLYRQALTAAGVDDTGDGPLPEWSPSTAVAAMDALGVTRAIVSAPTPGTAFLPRAADAAALARDLNDYSADLVGSRPERFGFFATLPAPHMAEAATEADRALDRLGADGVMMLANSAGVYLGEAGQDELFDVLDAAEAVVFVHPAGLAGPAVAGIPPFAADFLLDTTRAAYLLVRNGIRRRFPRIRFLLSHAGGFVPYASLRLAVTIAADTGEDVDDILADFAGFYFDTALSTGPATLPCLLGFADEGHVVFGSDCPFASGAVAQRFADALTACPGLDEAARAAIDHRNAEALLSRRPG